MNTLQIDVEHGYCHHHHNSSSSDDSSSCYSQFYSTVDNQSFACISDIEKGSVIGSQRVSCSSSECDNVSKKEERDCRICHVSLENGDDDECGIGIELGCSCKDDLAAAHKTCAETWFNIKGNKTCEICNSVAKNVFCTNESESTLQVNDPSITTTNEVPAQSPSQTESQSCINGQRLVNFLLACMVFIFIISWLFHFNIHS